MDETYENKIITIKKILDEKDYSKSSVLIGYLKDKNYKIREMASNALVNIGTDLEVINILMEAISSDDPNYRNSAIASLVLMGEKAIPYLITEINNKDKDVRKFVIDSLGDIGSEKAIPYIIQRIDDIDENVEQSVCENLGKIGSPKGVETLIKALEKNDWIQFAAIEALGEIGDFSAVSHIIKIMKISNDWIKYVAIEALGKIGDETVLSHLCDEFFSENDEILKITVISIHKIVKNSKLKLCENINEKKELISKKLKQILEGDISQEITIPILSLIGILKLEKLYNVLIQGLLSNRQDISETALMSIKKYGEKGISKIENSLNENSHNLDYEVVLIYILGEIGAQSNKKEEVFKVIEMYIKREEEEIREVAIEALYKINKLQSKDYILKSIDDKSGNVRKMALHLMLDYKFDVSLEKIFKVLEDEYEDVRIAGEDLLVEIGKKRVEKLLIKKLKENINIINFPAVTHLIKIVGRLEILSGIGVIIELIEKYDELKEVGIQNLGKLRSRIALDYLIGKLKEENIQIRRMVADALGKINDDIVVQSLIEILDDDNEWVRYFAVNSLNNFKNEKILNKYIEMLRYTEESQVIIEILNGIGKYEDFLENEKIYEVVDKYIEDKDEDIQCAAIACLKKIILRNKKIRSRVIKMLETKSWKIKNSILELLFNVELENEEYIYVLPLLKDDNLIVKQKSLEIIGKSGKLNLLKPMIESIMDENLEEVAKRLLEKVKENGYPRLLEGLKSEYDAIRIFTANSLKIIGDISAVDILIESLKDSNWKVRYFSAEALGIINSEKALKPLTTLLNDKNEYVINAALNAIRKIGRA
ncbi:HEAT repeat domain-containing protein [Haliovirga abyssi]|uniref:HEAT repeat domain-containing protein n=1 Tax=Haliovirga abyssi TaxID=2996794 RepID=A0AAU9DPE6_9FUSO|nr:HEAT repeat domain-containing protein [Haliovirga abyssi]BDU50293.1 hypothetical protein HLVA_08620 [Haliovirga abyssi]